MNNKTAAAALIVCVLIGVAVAAVVENWVFHSTGEIKIEAYLSTLDDKDTPYTNGTAIDWGILDPGATYYINLTVHNISPITVEVYISNQGIDAYPYLTCAWTGDHAILDPDQSVVGNLTLTVALSAVSGESFSFDTILHADDLA